MADEADRLLATIRKNRREEIRVQLRSFKGVRSVDVRVYVENGDGEPVPTGKGVSLQPGLLRETIGALARALDVALHEGLLS